MQDTTDPAANVPNAPYLEVMASVMRPEEELEDMRRQAAKVGAGNLGSASCCSICVSSLERGFAAGFICVRLSS